jgi:hypothetical protein
MDRLEPSYVAKMQITPQDGLFDVRHKIKTPHQQVIIEWEKYNTRGRTETEAWLIQHELDCLKLAGYRILYLEI